MANSPNTDPESSDWRQALSGALPPLTRREVRPSRAYAYLVSGEVPPNEYRDLVLRDWLEAEPRRIRARTSLHNGLRRLTCLGIRLRVRWGWRWHNRSLRPDPKRASVLQISSALTPQR